MLPWRGIAGDPDRPSGPPLPPARMPVLRGGRPLKRWRYVAGFGETLMLCAAYARIGGLAQAWWAIWDREERSLRERTTFRRPARVVHLTHGRVLVRDGDIEIDLRFDEVPGVETASPHGQDVIWTRKQPVVLRGTVRTPVGTREVILDGLVDDSAGYHARETAWRWAAGVGRLRDGRAVAFNLVDGVHDAPAASERSVWVDGVAHEVAPVRFEPALAGVGFAEGEVLRFTTEARRARDDAIGLLASDYEQPFGTFSGALPGAGELAEGFGVMERHRARW